MATTSRFGGAAGDDNTSRILTNSYQNPAYAATIALTVNKANTIVKVAQLTGALTMTASVGTSTTAPFVGDKLTILFGADGTNRVVTFSTGFATAGTLTVVAAKFGSASFMFDGAAWVEVSRALTA